MLRSLNFSFLLTSLLLTSLLLTSLLLTSLLLTSLLLTSPLPACHFCDEREVVILLAISLTKSITSLCGRISFTQSVHICLPIFHLLLAKSLLLLLESFTCSITSMMSVKQSFYQSFLSRNMSLPLCRNASFTHPVHFGYPTCHFCS